MNDNWYCILITLIRMNLYFLATFNAVIFLMVATTFNAVLSILKHIGLNLKMSLKNNQYFKEYTIPLGFTLFLNFFLKFNYHHLDNLCDNTYVSGECFSAFQ